VTDVVPSKNPPSNPSRRNPRRLLRSPSRPIGTKSSEGVSNRAHAPQRKPEKKRSFWKELPILIVTRWC